MTGHPLLGVAHLVPYLGDDVVAHDSRKLWMRIPDRAADAPFNWAPDHSGLPAEVTGRVARATLSESAFILIAGMVEDGNPSLDRLAMMAGRSRRTMQRLLSAEGVSFVELLDSVRRELALSRLNDTESPVSVIAQDLGFSTSSGLSRAVRRWTASSPRRLRRGSGSLNP
jgi:AraC-like DNA-binding protein